MTIRSTILRPMTTRKRAGAAVWLAGLMGLVFSIFPGAASGQTAPTSLPVIVADFNHDGIPDALVPASSGAMATIAFGTTPYGSFSSNAKAVAFPSACTGFVADAGNAGNLLAGDFNGDGFADLLFVCNTGNSTTLTGIMLGVGDGTFAAPVTLTTAYSEGAVLGDFNHDGKLDAVVVAYPNGLQGTNAQTPSILFFGGVGDGTFATAISSPLGSTTTFQTGNFMLGSPVAADVNGDGYPDIVLNAAYGYAPTNYTGATLTISVFGNRKDGTFGATAQAFRVPDATAVVGTYPASNNLKVIAGSFSDLGKTDFVVPDAGTPGYFLVKNTSTATTYSFATPVKTAYAGLTAAAGGSFTGSGTTDLVVANGSNLTVLANDGTGNFSANYGALSLPATSSLFAVADANLDGYADLYTAALGTTLGLKVNLVNGSATATTQPFSLSIGTKQTAATWVGNVLFTGATLQGTQTVNGALSMTGLVSSKNPSTLGDSVSFTAAVASATGATVVPTGMVVFSDGTNMLRSVALDPTGMAVLTTSALTVATHAIVATYAGDGFYAASSSTVLPQVVSRPLQVAPILTWPAPAAIPYGTPLSGAQLDAVATNATGAAVAGTFVYVPAAGTVLNAGAQTLRVTFTPTDLTTYAVATVTVPLTVLPASATTGLAVTSGGAAVSSVAAGSVVTLTASVAAGTVPVTVGQVKFCDAAATYCTDIHLLGTSQLTSAGTAVLRFVPGIGAHSYKAVFVGTGNDVGSASAAVPLTVTGAFATTTTIAQSGAVGNYTLTATVTGKGNGSQAPTGTVSFLDTSNGSASVSTAVLGPGVFGLSSTGVATPTGIENPQTRSAIGDFNGDGILDVATANTAPDVNQTVYANTVTVSLGNGDGTFRTVSARPGTGVRPTSIVAGDFNGDGKLDLATTNSSDGTVTILLGNGDGTFTAAASPTAGASPYGIVAGDFNGDGSLDLAVSATGQVTLLLGNGDGTFTPHPVSVPYGSLASLATADFNGDGKADLAVMSYSPTAQIIVLLGNGDGTFTSTVALSGTSAGSNLNALAVGDFNGDGKPDLASTNFSANTVSILLGNGDGTFVASLAASATGSNPNDVQTGDFNGDGRLDLAVVNFSQAGETILLGNGDGTFTTPAIPTGVRAYDAVSVGDFNGDGVPDLVGTDGSANLEVALTRLTQTASAIATGVAPLGAGMHPIVASYPGDAGYAASVSAATSLTGQTVTPVLTWTPAVSTIVYGTALGPQQLNAVATGTGGVSVPGTFAYTPAAGTVLGSGLQTLRVVFTPTSNIYVPVSGSATITVTPAQPRITWATPAPIAYGTALSGTQLNATVTGVGTGALAGVLTYAPAAGAVLAPGTQALNVSFTPTDTLNYTSATASVPLTVTGLVLTSITPAALPLGSPASTVTLTGSGFVTSSVVQVNGTAVATSYVNPTTLTASVPATYLAQTGTLAIRVLDPSISAVSAALNLTVAPMNPSITLTGPGVTSPGSQPTVTLTIVNPYPLPLTATFSLSFASSGATSVDDPAIQFAAGGRTLTIVVPANSTVVPPIQLQAGTDAGTITIPLALTTGGINVTPTGLAPVVIVVPATVPTISTTTVTRGTGTFSVAIHGFSNTREVTMATFHFVAAPGATISTPDITAPVGTVFGGWFGSTASVAFGSTFTYTQVFNVSDDPKNIGSVQVTLTNGVGASAVNAAQ